MLTLKALWAMFCDFIAAFWERVGIPLMLVFITAGPLLSIGLFEAGYEVASIVIGVPTVLAQAAFILFMLYLLAKAFLQSLNKKKDIQRKENNPE